MTSASQAVRHDAGTRQVDHLVYAVPEFDSAVAAMSQALGLALTAGGEHPQLGTSNAILSLGGRQYLEVLGPTAGTTHSTAFSQSLAAQAEPDILTFAMESSDLDEVVARARDAGLEVESVGEGSRVTPTGERLAWRGLKFVDIGLAGLVPFFIDWGTTPHPALSAAQGPRLDRLWVAHPRSDALQSIYKALGVPISVLDAQSPQIAVTISHAGRVLELRGSGRGLGT